jgi:hypothetical protein
MRFTGSNADFVDDGQGGRFASGLYKGPLASLEPRSAAADPRGAAT